MQKIYLIFFIVLLSSCSSNDCEKLPTAFTSFDEAVKQIENAHFNFKDNINTSKSSWIREAKYFSCDNKTGFFILKTDKEDYVYQNLPIEIWTGFKNATSFGSYYNRNIKHKYKLQLTSDK